MDAKAVELETARIKSIIAKAQYQGVNETVKRVMDFVLLDKDKSPPFDQVFKFMFDLSVTASEYATETRNKYEELRGDLFYGS